MNHENLDNQLENLFSDIDVPEPLIPHEATAEAAHAGAGTLDSFQALEHITPPHPQTPVEPAVAPPPPPPVAQPDHTLSRKTFQQPAPKKPAKITSWRLGLVQWLLFTLLIIATIPSLVITVAGSALLASLITVTLAALLAFFLAHRIAKPINQIAESARRMTAGDLQQSAPIERTDEIGDLERAINHMAGKLRMTDETLNSETARQSARLHQVNLQLQKQTQYLESSAEISCVVASILNPQELMQVAVDLVKDHFNFYSVSLFLLDDSGDWAVVKASTGEAGRQLVALPYKLRVDGDNLVGWVCTHSQPRVAFDVGDDAVFFDHPLLLDTRSELILPLLAQGRLLGALDIHCTKQAAFDDEDLHSLQSIADIIAVAVQNASLFSQTRRSADRQQVVARITDRMQQATSISNILTTTLEDLGETYDLAQAIACLGSEDELLAARTGSERKTEKE